MIRWLAEYSRQKNLTFLPPWNLTDVTVKKFTRAKNLNFLPPWGGGQEGGFEGSIISTSYHCQSSRRNEASTSSSMLSMRLQKKSRPVCSSR